MERLFLAIRPEALVIDQLAIWQDDLRQGPRFRGARWIRPENLHLTLHFLGDVASEDVPRLVARLKQVPVPSGFPCPQTLDELTGFPRSQSATVLVLGGSSTCRPLAELHELLKPALLELGIAVEKRAYAPHVTLARFRYPARLHLQGIQPPSVTLAIGSFVLYRSRLGQAGSRYEMIQEIPLAGRLCA